MMDQPAQQQTPPGGTGEMTLVTAVYVLLASDEPNYVSGACIAVTSGVPIL